MGIKAKEEPVEVFRERIDLLQLGIDVDLPLSQQSKRSVRRYHDYNGGKGPQYFRLPEPQHVFTPTEEMRPNDVPIKLSEALDDVVSKLTESHFPGAHAGSGPNVTLVAYDIINDSDLRLGLREWAVVQEMIERGITTGYALGRGSAA